MEDIEIMSKRKGKITFSRNGVKPTITKTDEETMPDDLT